MPQKHLDCILTANPGLRSRLLFAERDGEMFFRPKHLEAQMLKFGLALLLAVTSVSAQQVPRYSSRYKSPVIYGGLFYVVKSSIPNEDDQRALVLSFNNKPIEPKANDPDAPTIPGFYLTFKDRYDFEKVEIIRRKVYFKTRPVGGISYKFVGISGNESDPDFDIPIPFIKGKLTKVKHGKVTKREHVKFSHAVIY
jgi:hypothetical protein